MESPSCPSRVEGADETLAMSLAMRLKDAEKDEDSDVEDSDDDDKNFKNPLFSYMNNSMNPNQIAFCHHTYEPTNFNSSEI